MTGAIETVGLFAGYGRIAVVRDLDLTVDAGEVVALLGPNGAGKTTTLLTIAGFSHRSVATFVYSGDRWRAAHRTASPSGVWDSCHKTVVCVRASRWGRTCRLANGRRSRPLLDEVVELFPQLPPLWHRRCGLLSGGEQQMLGIAKALVATRKALMIDEMSLGLAPTVVDRLLPVVGHIARARDVGVLLVEQHVHKALSIADRAYVLDHGQLALEGRAKDLLQQRELLEMSYLGVEAADALPRMTNSSHLERRVGVASATMPTQQVLGH